MIPYTPPEIDENSIDSLRFVNPPYLVAVEKIGLINQLQIPLFFTSLYKKYVKPYGWLRTFILYIFKFIYPIFLSFLALLKNHSNLRWRKLLTLSKYVEEQKCEKFPIHSREKITFGSALDVYPKSKSYLIESFSEKESFFPEIYITNISEAIVIGGTSLISAGNYVVSHDFLDLNEELTSEEIHRFIVINKNYSKVRLTSTENISDLILPVAATFLDACSSNYAHWMSEILPKILIFSQDERFKDVPIVVDANLHTNLVDSLLMVVGKTRQIYMLERKVSLKVCKLYVVSSVGYVPFGNRLNTNNNKFHGVFSKFSLLKLKGTLNSFVDCSFKHNFPNKIYLNRFGLRTLSNFEMIGKIVCEKKFVRVDVDKLSLLQQLHLFSNAHEIVAPTGASLANLIFCKPGTVVYVLIAEHQDMIYRYWFNMLSHLGIRVKLVIGKQERSSLDSIHSDYKIESEDLKYALETK